jgi:hypothetical protein
MKRLAHWKLEQMNNKRREQTSGDFLFRLCCCTVCQAGNTRTPREWESAEYKWGDKVRKKAKRKYRVKRKIVWYVEKRQSSTYFLPLNQIPSFL